MPRYHPSGTGVPILVGVTASQAFPLATVAHVDPAWNHPVAGSVPEASLEIWAAGNVNLTAAEIFGGSLETLVVADTTFTATASSDELAATAHGMFTGDGPVRVANSGGALPGGLAAATDYWVIRIDANTFKLATTLALALAGTPIDITSNGTGTQTLSDVVGSTKRVQWLSYGLLGHAQDGAITLTAQRGYVTRLKHRPRTIAYGMICTLSAGVAVNATVFPAQES